MDNSIEAIRVGTIINYSFIIIGRIWIEKKKIKTKRFRPGIEPLVRLAVEVLVYIH